MDEETALILETITWALMNCACIEDQNGLQGVLSQLEAIVERNRKRPGS